MNVTTSQVVGFLYKSKIEEEATCLSGTEKGGLGWFPHYSKALSNIMNNLEDDKMERVTEVKERWLKAEIPTDIRGQ